jgi:RNA polymerase sigma-70 factor (ECF subfamily)
MTVDVTVDMTIEASMPCCNARRHRHLFKRDHDEMSANVVEPQSAGETGPAHSPGEPDAADTAARRAFLAWVGRLVHQHRASLARVARREGLGPDDAFDAVQEAFYTFISLPQARSLVDQPEQSRRLLMVLTRNVSRNRRRLHAVARPHTSEAETLDGIASDAASVEEVMAAAEEHVRLAGCLRTLAELPKTIVTLRMLDDVPGEDVARMLGVTPGHVAVLLHRAKANLLACMTACP